MPRPPCDWPGEIIVRVTTKCPGFLRYRHAMRTYLFTQCPFRSDDFFEHVLPHLCVHSTKWIIQQVDISIEIHSSCQVDTLFLTSTQVNTLKHTTLRNISFPCRVSLLPAPGKRDAEVGFGDIRESSVDFRSYSQSNWWKFRSPLTSSGNFGRF